MDASVLFQGGDLLFEKRDAFTDGSAGERHRLERRRIELVVPGQRVRRRDRAGAEFPLAATTIAPLLLAMI